MDHNLFQRVLKRTAVTRTIGVLSALLTVTGFAAAAPKLRVPSHSTASATTANIQCTKERVTGSLIATQVCTFKEQRDSIAQDTQDAKDFLTHQVIAVCPRAPGCKN